MSLVSKDIFSVWEEIKKVALIKISTQEKIKYINIPKGDAFKTNLYSLRKFSEYIMIVFAFISFAKKSF